MQDYTIVKAIVKEEVEALLNLYPRASVFHFGPRLPRKMSRISSTLLANAYPGDYCDTPSFCLSVDGDDGVGHWSFTSPSQFFEVATMYLHLRALSDSQLIGL